MDLEAAAKAWARTGQALPTPLQCHHPGGLSQPLFGPAIGSAGPAPPPAKAPKLLHEPLHGRRHGDRCANGARAGAQARPVGASVVEAPLVRIAVTPSPRNGLRKPSQLMVDKLFSVPIQALRAVVGQLEPQVLIELDLALRGWLDLP